MFRLGRQLHSMIFSLEEFIMYHSLLDPQRSEVTSNSCLGYVYFHLDSIHVFG